MKGPLEGGPLRYIGPVIALAIGIVVAVWLARGLAYEWLPPEWVNLLGAGTIGFLAGGLLMNRYNRRGLLRDPRSAIRSAAVEERYVNPDAVVEKTIASLRDSEGLNRQ